MGPFVKPTSFARGHPVPKPFFPGSAAGWVVQSTAALGGGSLTRSLLSRAAPSVPFFLKVPCWAQRLCSSPPTSFHQQWLKIDFPVLGSNSNSEKSGASLGNEPCVVRVLSACLWLREALKGEAGLSIRYVFCVRAVLWRAKVQLPGLRSCSLEEGEHFSSHGLAKFAFLLVLLSEGCVQRETGLDYTETGAQGSRSLCPSHSAAAGLFSMSHLACKRRQTCLWRKHSVPFSA